MIPYGTHQTLSLLRNTSVGAYVGNETYEILLPAKWVPSNISIGDELRVFIYKDAENRPIATTLEPKITLGHFACLNVKEANDIGAFLDWGLEKDVFLPHREQTRNLKAGDRQVVYLYLDDKSERLVVSAKINRFLSKEPAPLKTGTEVDIIPFETTPLGINVIVNQTYKGLIYHNEIKGQVRYGIKQKAFVREVREEGGIDISVDPLGLQRLEDGAERILEALRKSKGFLALHDKSSVDEIQERLGLSKKTFKRAVGTLLKQQRIVLSDDGIREKQA